VPVARIRRSRQDVGHQPRDDEPHPFLDIDATKIRIQPHVQGDIFSRVCGMRNRKNAVT